MKRNKKIGLFVLLVIIIIAAIFLILYSSKPKTILYLGENENWECEFKVDTTENPQTGLYYTYTEIQYKNDIIPASKLVAKIMHDDVQISTAERNEPNNGHRMTNRVSVSDGSSGMPVFTMPLSVHISIDDGAYEVIQLDLKQ